MPSTIDGFEMSRRKMYLPCRIASLKPAVSPPFKEQSGGERARLTVCLFLTFSPRSSVLRRSSAGVAEKPIVPCQPTQSHSPSCLDLGHESTDLQFAGDLEVCSRRPCRVCERGEGVSLERGTSVVSSEQRTVQELTLRGSPSSCSSSLSRNSPTLTDQRSLFLA